MKTSMQVRKSNNINIVIDDVWRFFGNGINFFVGSQAGNSFYTGTNNTFIGTNVASSGFNSGSHNIFIGYFWG